MKSVNSLNPILWATESGFKALKCQIWLTNTKPYFWESEANVKTLEKPFPQIWFFYNFVLLSVKSLNRVLWALESWFEALKCQIWLTNKKLFFWESEVNVETLQKFSPYIWVCYKFVLKSIKSLNRILLATEPWFEALKCQIWLTNTKPFFWESDANVETLQNLLCIWVSYKFVLKSVKSLNRILWATEYWFKSLKCQIWLTNTKPFFWESEANVETLQKPSPYIWVSYKFVLKSVKSLNRILWATEYWFKALKCQIWLTNTKPFSWESEANVEYLQKPSSYIWVSYKLVLKSV